MDKTNNRIREEWREQIEIWKDTPSPENEGEATEIVTNWCLSKITELLKSQEHKLREEMIEKIRKMIKIVNYQLGGFVIEDESYNEAIKDIISIIKEE